jgi:hypothetical protein
MSFSSEVLYWLSVCFDVLFRNLLLTVRPKCKEVRSPYSINMFVKTFIILVSHECEKTEEW